MNSFNILKCFAILLALTPNSNASLRNIVCKEDENCVTSLCCYFEEIFGVAGTAYNFQATIHPSYIRKIRFINSSFPEIPPGMFTYFTSLAELDLRNTGLSKTNDYSFNGARRLITVYLSHNQLEKLSNMMFYGAFGLGYLDLSHNNIDEIEEFAFYGLKTLNTLDLSFNKIKTLPAKCFNTLEAFYSLNLAHNVVDDLHDEIFIDNLFLTKVDLSNNSLVELDKKLFRYNKNVRILNVGGNHLDDVEFLDAMDVNRIEDLDLSKNVLHHLNFTVIGAMRNLRKLNISHTGTDAIEPTEMGRLKNLYTLDLSGNDLKRFSLNVSSILDNLTRFYCNACGLTAVDHEKVKTTFPNLKYVALAGNKWNCNYLNQLRNNLKNVGVEEVDTGADCSVGAPAKLVVQKVNTCLDEVALARIKTKEGIKNKLEEIENKIKEEVKSLLTKKAAEIADEIIKNNADLLNTLWD